jgi:hypothetical protein
VSPTRCRIWVDDQNQGRGGSTARVQGVGYWRIAWADHVCTCAISACGTYTKSTRDRPVCLTSNGPEPLLRLLYTSCRAQAIATNCATLYPLAYLEMECRSITLALVRIYASSSGNNYLSSRHSWKISGPGWYRKQAAEANIWKLEGYGWYKSHPKMALNEEDRPLPSVPLTAAFRFHSLSDK